MRYLVPLLAIVHPFFVSPAEERRIILWFIYPTKRRFSLHWLCSPRLQLAVAQLFIGWVLCRLSDSSANLYAPVLQSWSDEITSIIVLKLLYNGLRLRHYPGGWLWKLSDLTYVFHAIKGDLDRHVYDLHTKYGTLFNLVYYLLWFRRCRKNPTESSLLHKYRGIARYLRISLKSS